MIEINIRLDFSTDNVFPDGNNLGYVGEHNATTLTVTPPPEMTANENIAFYCLAFEVGNDFIKKVIRSALLPKAESFDVKLWQQVTIGENLKIQLEAYDSENSLLIKTKYADAVLSPSVSGVQSGTDTSGQSLAGMVAAHEAKLSRLTAVFEFEGSADSFTMPDMPGTMQLIVGDFYMDSNIPIGAEIKSIEFMFDESIGWIDTHEMITVDGIPYILNMARTFDGANVYGDSNTCFAIISYLNEGNFLYEAAHAFLNGKIRITYYTDNIGGESNA